MTFEEKNVMAVQSLVITVAVLAHSENRVLDILGAIGYTDKEEIEKLGFTEELLKELASTNEGEKE